MNRKIVGIFICTLLIILTAFPSFGKMTEQSFVRNNDYVMNNSLDDSIINEIPEGLWVIRGIFKFLDEDDENIYLRIINARFMGIGAGLMFYHLRFPVSIKISKPFFGFLPTGSIPLLGLGLCKKWDYIEDDIQIEEKGTDGLIFISKSYNIELNGKFVRAFHFLYHKTIIKDTYSIGMSIIRFSEADVSINDGEITEYGSGLLFLYRYRGIYDHDSINDSLIIDGSASFLKLKMIR